MRLRFLFLFILAFGPTGCTRQAPQSSPLTAEKTVTVPVAPLLPAQAQGPEIRPTEIPRGKSKIITLSNGAEMVLENHGGILYYGVEAVFSQLSFTRMSASTARFSRTEQHALFAREISKIMSQIRPLGALNVRSVPELGFFSFQFPYSADGDLFGPLKNLRLPHEILVNPVVIDRLSLRTVKNLAPSNDGPPLKNLSGLESIHAIDFVKRAQVEVGDGIKIDGSSVRIGITDTGITYNHPTFKSKDGTHTRITYMKDFTREGRVYFNPDAKFQAKSPVGDFPEDLIVNAQVIITPSLPNLPEGDRLTEVKDLQIKVSADLKKLLESPNSQAKLGVLTEASLQGRGPNGEAVDLNGNGKVTDNLWMILIPGASSAENRVYFDSTGTGDFRHSPALGNWNSTGTLMDVFAEKVGFDLHDETLPSTQAGKSIDVTSASIVGFDPGNHGTHVAGIAAGQKTIANDDDETQARGVAPAAQILMDRVCANSGGCSASEAMIDLALEGHADVINMSLGGLNPFNDGYGVQETLINRITAKKNILFIVSAGNAGPGRQTVGSPAVARFALSVGATANQAMIQRQYQWPGTGGANATSDFLFFFSSRGPTAAGGFKPEISAPGTEMSSVQLNAGPGSHGGLDVYWGTSMAAPTATGAYALLLDAIKKYNLQNGSRPLTTNAVALKQILMESARPFEESTFDPATGAKTDGQYTWTDEGAGMVDLVGAWSKVFELRDRVLSSAVQSSKGESIDLDYPVLVPMESPRGVAYDGSRTGAGVKQPAFGSGLYLEFEGTDTLRHVQIARVLPEAAASGMEAGALTRQLLTTRDEFVLKTVIHGSDKEWLRVGTLDQLDCSSSTVPATVPARFTVFGGGAEIKSNPDGTGEVHDFPASTLNVCLNREMIATELAPGDHGALISAYRVKDGKTAAVASFIVPVSLTVPHRVLGGKTGYLVEKEIRSFDVSRNYVTLPAGTTLVQVSLEVPAFKKGEQCSGVELMALEGSNVDRLIENRKDARIFNCDADGATTDEEDRVLRVSRTKPKAGTWDLHVFGSYRFAKSKFKLRVDYVTASASIGKIEGGLAALNGTLTWNIQETSMPVSPNAAFSTFALTGLKGEVTSKVAKGEHLILESPLGKKGALVKFRTYPPEAHSVELTTGGSPGNDLDIVLWECNAGATDLTDPSCKQLTSSGGATDEEDVTFSPSVGKSYALQVDGFEVKDSGRFESTEKIQYAAETGKVSVVSNDPKFTVHYEIEELALKSSKVLQTELFKGGKFSAIGALTLKSDGSTVLDSIPLVIRSQ